MPFVSITGGNLPYTQLRMAPLHEFTIDTQVELSIGVYESIQRHACTLYNVGIPHISEFFANKFSFLRPRVPVPAIVSGQNKEVAL
jgi:hypothetical protein